MLPNDYKSGLVLRQDLIKYNNDKRTFDLLERNMTLWILGKSVGFSALFGGIFMLLLGIFTLLLGIFTLLLPYIKELDIPQYYRFLFYRSLFIILLIVFGYCMLMIGRKGLEEYYEERLHLSEANLNKKWKYVQATLSWMQPLLRSRATRN